MSTTYLVTGASRGLGLEFVRQLTARGDHVIATAREHQRAAALQELADAGRGSLKVCPLEVTSAASLDHLAATLEGRPIDVLINNAGVSSDTKTLAGLTFDNLHQVFQTNTFAPLLVTQKLLRNLRAGRRRTVIQISSQLASITNNLAPGGGGSSYGYRASKTALNMLNASLALELKSENFTCVALHPGWVQTDMGGPNAHLTPPDAIRAMLDVIDRVTPLDSGRFLNFDGKPLPW